MNCPNCNTPNRDDGKFCISCGSTLPPPASPPAPVYQQPAPVYAPSAPQAGYPPQDSYAPAYAPASQAPAQAPQAQGQPLPAQGHALGPASSVVVTDVGMTFRSMVVFQLKWTLATLVAILLVGSVLGVIAFIFAAIVSALLGLGLLF